MVSWLTAAGPAASEPCAGAEARLTLIGQRLDHDARRGRIHGWSFGLGYLALASTQGVLAVVSDDDADQTKWSIGAAKSALGLIPIVFQPVPAMRDADRLAARRAAMAAPGGPDRCAVVTEAEAALARSADNEAQASGWLSHALTIAINGGGMVVLGLAHDRWAEGAIDALIGTAVGELAILTRPTAARDGRRADGVRLGLVPVVGPGQFGWTVVGEF